jgi:hypothetical protein
MTYKGYSARVAYDDNELFTPKTFNNHFSFERGLWRWKRGSFPPVPKRRVLGTVPNGGYADKATVYKNKLFVHR